MLTTQPQLHFRVCEFGHHPRGYIAHWNQQIAIINVAICRFCQVFS